MPIPPLVVGAATIAGAGFSASSAVNNHKQTKEEEKQTAELQAQGGGKPPGTGEIPTPSQDPSALDSIRNTIKSML